MSRYSLPGKKYRVLVVEDDEHASEALKWLLEPMCKEVVLKHDGLSAYRAVTEDEEGFDMVLSDIQIPKLNGIELLGKIKSIKPELPVVIVSAFDDKEYLLSAINLKAEHYLIKPINRDDIKALFERCFGRSLKEKEEFFYNESPCSYEHLNSIFCHGHECVKLAKRENLLLKLFFSNKQHTLTTKEIGLALWGEENVSKDAMHSFIRRFRQKLPKDILKLKGKGRYLLDIVPINHEYGLG